ncbi:MAG: histidine kinase dimerization/phosphoacceptor domain -containing protein [Cyclobacteriaceae bacterium]
MTSRTHSAAVLIDSALSLSRRETNTIDAQINYNAGVELTEMSKYDEAELCYAAAIHSGRSAGDTDILIEAHLQRALSQAYDWQIEDAFANIDIADSLLRTQKQTNKSLLSRHIRNYTIYRDNRLDEALALAVELAAQSKQADDISVFKKSKDLESHIYYHKGDYPPAIEGYKILLAQAEEEGNLYDQVKWLNSLSYAYRMLGIFEEAVNYANNCIKVSEKYGYEIGKADAYVRLSQTFFDNKQHDKTLDAIDNAFNIYTALNDENGVALCNNSYANAYEIKQEYQKALEYYEKSLAFRRTQSSAYHVVPLYNIGNVLILQERPHEAKPYLEESLSICNAQGIIGMKIRNLLGLSEAASLLGDHKKAIDLVLEAEELVNKTLYKRMIRDTYQTKSKVFAESGRYEEAYVAHQHFKTLEDSLFNESRNKQFANQAIKYETQKKDQENILLKKGLDLERSKTRAQNQLVFFVGALLILALVFGLVQANNNRKLNKRSALIENQKKSIETRNERIETLLKEVHHRVKNNLQLIISLLDTDRSWHKDADPSSLLADSRSRVATMSLLHQSLYKHDDLVTLNIKDYIEELVSQIIEINDTRLPDHMILDIPSVDLDIDTAIPLGLIVNELVTNVFKYGEKDGLLSLAIKMTKSAEGNYRLTVQDKGQDLPMPLSEILKESYGLKLTSGLSRQLHGQLTHQYENGNIFMVTVKDTLRRKEAA